MLSRGPGNLNRINLDEGDRATFDCLRPKADNEAPKKITVTTVGEIRVALKVWEAEAERAVLCESKRFKTVLSACAARAGSLPARRGAQGGIARQELAEDKSHSTIVLLDIKREVFKGFYQRVLDENA